MQGLKLKNDFVIVQEYQTQNENIKTCQAKVTFIIIDQAYYLK